MIDCVFDQSRDGEVSETVQVSMGDVIDSVPTMTERVNGDRYNREQSRMRTSCLVESK